MNPTLRHPDRDEPALTSPELRRLVEGVRAAPPPVLKASADAVFAGFEARRAARRRGLGVLALAAAAALALLALRPWAMSSSPGPSEPVARNTSTASPALPGPPAPALAAAVHLERAEGPPPLVRGAWALDLAPGSYTLRVDEHPGAEPLRVATPTGTLEVRHGRVELVVAAAASVATLRSGVALWLAPGGARRELALDEPVSSDLSSASDDPSALARRADERLAAGERDAAIALLRRLVLDHPDSPPARAGLLDLARLLRAAARLDEARCAYALYLARYPEREQLADEVERALARLGPGPACDGLRPR